MISPAKYRRAALCALLLTSATPALSQNESDASAVIATAFPDLAESDLTLEDGYRLGVLDNGMRYIIRANATPPERGLVRMWVDFGSVAERADEQGYAHFIEHMAFNGTTNVPEGEMVALLEREGLSFGADTNASTGFDATQYRLDLPRNDADLLGTALMLMREVASEVSFDDAAVEREKGIILSERRVRDTFGFRAGVDNFAFTWPGSRISQRLPIGTIETIEAANGDRLRELYDRYYRPQNVAIVVVGDYDPDMVEQAIAQHFADWRGPQPLEATGFGPVDFDNAGRTDIYADPALSEQITISQIGPWRERPDTIENRAKATAVRIAHSIIGRRLVRLARSDDPPFRSARIGTSNFGEEARLTSLTVNAVEGKWQEGLAAAQSEYRRALEHGFTRAEVDEQLANLRNSLENSLAGADTRGNGTFAGLALNLLMNGRIPVSPEDALSRFEALAPELTPDRILAALRDDLIALENPLIRFQGRSVPEGGEQALRDAWNANQSIAIAPPAERETVEFAYTDFGPSGEVVSAETDDAVGIQRIRFANGVMLNLRQTDLQEDRILISIAVDGGNMLKTRNNPLATSITGALLAGGLGAHTIDELQSILAGRSVGPSFSSAAENFRLNRATTPDDLELQLQLMAATLTDAAFRPTGEQQFRQSVENSYARLTATPAAALSSQLGAILSDGDPRFSLPEQEELLALTVADLRPVIADRLQSGAIEIGMVGDFDMQAAIDTVAATFGALPERESEFLPYAERRDRTFTADRSVRTLYHDGEADQAMLVMLWPTRDDDDFAESLSLELTERVLRLQLQSILREELGQTYSPRVNASQSAIFDDYGTFTMSAQIAVQDVNDVREAMLRALRELTEASIADDLLLRARQPMLESYDNALETNPSWMGLVARAQTKPERIERYLEGRTLLESLSGEDIVQIIQRYLSRDDRLEIVVLPRIAGSDE